MSNAKSFRINGTFKGKDEDKNSLKAQTTEAEDNRNQRYKDDTKRKKWLTWWVVVVDSLWLASVMVLIWLQAFGRIALPLALWQALLATTTMNVLGLAYIILKNIFPSR